jgi:hypothetical protein
MMTSRLFVREVGASRFETHNGDFPTSELAEAEGQNLCTNGNVEEFQVWTLHSQFRRSTVVEKVELP